MKRGLIIIGATVLMLVGVITIGLRENEKEKSHYKFYKVITVVGNQLGHIHPDTLWQKGVYGIDNPNDTNIIKIDYSHLAYLGEWESIEDLESSVFVTGDDTMYTYTVEDINYMYHFLNDSTTIETIFVPVSI